MSREVCGICWCPYDEETGECACAPQGPTPPPEAQTEAEKMAYCAGWWDALAKARKAEPVQEPVAWRWGYRSVTTGEMDWRGYVEIAAHPNLRSPAIIMQPLYTAPPQRLPLTEEEIEVLEAKYAPPVHPNFSENDDWLAFARAVERAHGIGGEE